MDEETGNSYPLATRTEGHLGYVGEKSQLSPLQKKNLRKT